TITVTAVNADHSTATGYTGTIHFTSTDLQGVLPPDYTFASADSGMHTFTVTLKSSGNQTITATDTSNSTVAGNGSVAITAAAAQRFEITPSLSSVVAGTAFNITVTALDPYDNVATGYAGTVHFTSSSTKTVLPANYTFTSTDAGSHTFSIKLETAGSHNIAATDTANATITGQNSIAAEFPLPTATSGPEGIAVGPDGNLWFTETAASQIGMSTPAGSMMEFPLPTGSQPVSIVTGPDGNLWFTEEGTNKIGRMTTVGVLTEFAVATAASEPFGIAVGSDGNLWFTELAGNKIGRITTAGVFKEFALPAGSAPEGITAGPDKKLWFTESGTNDVAKITTTGTITAYALAAGSSPAMIVAGPKKGSLAHRAGDQQRCPGNHPGRHHDLCGADCGQPAVGHRGWA
ncbi:MAG TPA: hypothetical protein VFA18_11165, partial [Gemmataceae bacterium]|nr:hypothetical protein [Gemmataceae bacterium]